MADKPAWYVELTHASDHLAEELNLSPEQSDRLRDFLIATAKSQYMAGNRAGIYWARTGHSRPSPSHDDPNPSPCPDCGGHDSAHLRPSCHD